MSTKIHPQPLADLHCDTAIRLLRGQTLRDADGHLNLAKMKKGGVILQIFACWISPKFRHRAAYDQAVRLVRAVQRQIDVNPASVALVTDATTWQAASKAGKIGMVLGIEGGHALNGDPGCIEEFHQMGIRVLTLTWNNSNPFAATACNASKTGKDAGLSRMGRDLVRRADRLGVAIDLSHSSERTFWDVLEVSKRPAFVSHSCVAFINPHFRNLTDAQIRAAANGGGVIGINFCPAFLGQRRKPVDLDSVADQFEYIAELAGADCLALGSDFDGIGHVPRGLESIDKLPDLMRALTEHGFTRTQLAKIGIGNVLRYFGW